MSPPQLLNPDDAWLSSQTVLYVEDDESTRYQFSRFLRRRVGRLIEATNGAEGLERYLADHPVLVITDIEMPVMDGITMATEIRARSATVPIVITSAFEQVGYLRRSIDAGIGNFVPKPVNIERFEAVLRACAGRLRAEEEQVRERQREMDELKAREGELISGLARGMAHDFNNLLQSVIGNLDLVTGMPAADPEIPELLRSAQGAAHQARDLGKQLLTLAGTWFTEMRLQPIETTLRRSLPVRGLTLDLALPEGLPSVPHDARLLGLAFGHLAQNAREAMGAGGTLLVRGEVRPLAEGEVPPLVAGDYLRLSFRDAGPGIAPEVMRRIFDPYFSTKPQAAGRGVGLGLALCQSIVRSHRGLVTATSTPGEGAVFTVYLPLFGPGVKT